MFFKLKSFIRTKTQCYLALIICASLLVHAAALWINSAFMPGVRWISEPIHSSLEMAGACVSLFVAYFLLQTQKQNPERHTKTILSCALIGMGILDGAHALVPPGQSFVWLHSIATFIGGAMFSLVWSEKYLPKKYLPRIFSIFILILAIVSVSRPDLFPPMLYAGGFTPYARFLNFSGGFLFFMAAIRLIFNYLNTKDFDSMLFFLHCTLFGAASLMFEWSQLWDTAWWGWHILRFLAYVVALLFVINSFNMELSNERETMLKKLIQSSKLASIGELAAGIGHEINNPLTVVIGYGERIKKEIQKDKIEKSAIEGHVAKLETGAKRIKNIVSGLRAYSRMETDYSTTFDAHMIITDTVALIKELFAKDVELKYDLNAKHNSIQGDIGRFQQVLVILLNNSQDAVESVDSPEIVIKTKNENGRFVVSVKDNGVGIPKENHKKIFESFFTTKEIGKGTGLGLGILNKIVHDMSGEVVLESDVGKGSEFILSFPGVEKNTKTEQNEERSRYEKIDGKALVVDDESEIRNILRIYLQELGLSVDEAEDGDVALEKVKRNGYDYLISDLKMPRMSGEEFLDKARDYAGPDTKFIIITGDGYNLNENYVYSSDSRAYSVLLKPFNQKSLYEIIRKS